MCVHVKELCNRCEHFPQKEVNFNRTEEEREAREREKGGQQRQRRAGSASEAERRLDGRALAVQKCSPGSTFRELSSEGWLFQEKEPERSETKGENRRRDHERLQSEEEEESKEGEMRKIEQGRGSETRITAQEEKKRRIRCLVAKTKPELLSRC